MTRLYKISFLIISGVFLLASCARNAPDVRTSAADTNAFMSFIRNNGYDWYNTNKDGNTLHFDTSGAKVVNNQLVVKMVILYKQMVTNACGPLGVRGPRQFDEFLIVVDPINKYAVPRKMDGYRGSELLCTEYAQEEKRIYFNDQSVYGLWLQHWASMYPTKSDGDQQSGSSSISSGIEGLLR